MTFTVSYNIQAVDKFSGPAKKIIDSLKKIQEAVAITSLKMKTSFMSVEGSLTKMSSSLQSFGSKMLATGQKMRSFGTSMLVSTTLPIAAIGYSAISASAELETLRVKMNVLAGSEAMGKKMFDASINFEKRTPFTLSQWLPVQTMMLAAGVSADNVIGKMREIGDLAAGGASAGKGTSGNLLQRLGHSYAQVQAKGVMQRMDFLKFSRAGIDLAGPLEKALNMKGGETHANMLKLFELMKKGNLTIDVLNKALDEATGKGGKYEGMMEKLSHTFSGLSSTVLSNMKLAMGAIGDSMMKLGGIKNIMIWIIRQLKNFPAEFKKFSDSEFGKLFLKVTYGALLFLAVIGPIAIILGSLASIIGVLSFSFSGLLLVIRGVIGLFLFSGPWGLIIAAIGFLIGALMLVKEKFPETFQAGITWGLHFLKSIGNIIRGVLALIGLLVHLPTLLLSLDFSGIDARLKNIGSLFGLDGGSAVSTLPKNSQNVNLNGQLNVNAPPGVVKSGSIATKGSTGSVGMNFIPYGGGG